MLRENIDSLDAVVRASMDLDALSLLVQNRVKYHTETNEQLTEWLLNGSIILNSTGYIDIFLPLDGQRFPGVVKMKPNLSDGRHDCGDHFAIPSTDSLCPYCGNGFTLQDVYKRNFHYNCNTFFHSGECRKFHYRFNIVESFIKNLLVLCKRRFGTIEDLCIQSKNSNESTKISFIALGYKIETIFDEFGFITMSYSKDNTTCIFFESKAYWDSTLSMIDDKLYHWINTL